MKKLARVSLLLTLIALTACSTKSGRRMDTAILGQIERGKTTKSQLRELVGNPQFITQSPQGEMWMYYYNDAGYFTPVGVLVGKSGSENLSVTFDGEVVKDYHWSATQEQ